MLFYTICKAQDIPCLRPDLLMIFASLWHLQPQAVHPCHGRRLQWFLELASLVMSQTLGNSPE